MIPETPTWERVVQVAAVVILVGCVVVLAGLFANGLKDGTEPIPAPEGGWAPDYVDPTTTLPVEGQLGWDCETQGNGACGRVNVEMYDDHGETAVRIWDERNRLVFGPAIVERVER